MNKTILSEIDAGELSSGLDPALKALKENHALKRLWSQDYTLWRESPDEISNRLAWLHLPDEMPQHIEEINTFVAEAIADGYNFALLLGMGGSSLAPDVFQKVFDVRDGYIDVKVLDTTDADTIAAVANDLDLAHTLFIVSTKSGGTVETLSLFKFFYNQIVEELGENQAGDHFVGITDPGSNLQKLGDAYNFRKVFLNNPNLGGRYSALSFFGLVPAALQGVDLKKLLANAAETAINNGEETPPVDSPAARLGALLGYAEEQGRDKVTFLTHPEISSMGDWIEQLIAESTGKSGKGILPVVGEELADDLSNYSSDRVFIVTEYQGSSIFAETVQKLKNLGHPVVTFNLENKYQLGSLMLLWEIAVAIAGHIMDIHPFNQPNVEAAKKLARKSVETYQETGRLPESESQPLTADRVREFLSTAQTGSYIALQAFIPPTQENEAAFRALQATLRDTYQLPVTFGFGPRFLHSTGQLHKGDAGNGYFLQFRTTANHSLAIPEKAGEDQSFITFDVLKNAQAIGDAQALRDGDRKIIAFDLDGDPAAVINQLIQEF